MRGPCIGPRAGARATVARRVAAAVLPVLLAGAHPARADATLDYRGNVPPPREVRLLARPVLAAPADSAGRTAFLGALVARLQDDGHLQARASVRWDSAGGRLIVAVEPGPRYLLHSVRLDAGARGDSLEFAAGLSLPVGMPASPGAVDRAVKASVRAAVGDGFAYARLGVSGWHVSAEGVDLVLSGALGPQVVINAVDIEGLNVTRRDVVLRAMGPLEGRPYDPAAAEDARQRLEQLGLFTRVEWLGLGGDRDWRYGRLRYRVVEPRYNSFDGVVGVQGQTGTVGSARLELGNLLGTGRQVGLGWQSRGRGLTDLAARYVEPLVMGWPLAVRIGVEQQVQDTFYVRTRWGARGIFALSGQERLEAGYEQERDVQEHGDVQEADLQHTVFGIERNALDQRIGARRGSRVHVEAAGIFKREILRPEGSRKASASAVSLDGEWHRPFGRRTGLSLEWLAAGRFSTERVLPLYERYPIGGAATLRGFDEEAFRVDRYAISRLEWRWYFADEGAPRAFVFWDHGSMATREAVPAGGDRQSIVNADSWGAGLRIQAAGGIVGIDYGLETGRSPLDGKIHLRLVSTF